MKALNATVVIHVSDLNKAFDYYTRVLSFTHDFTFGDYMGLAYGDVCIHLNGPAHDGAKKPPGSAHFCIMCDYIDDYYQDICKKCAIISYPIGDRVYGMRDFSVDDLDGNTIVFGETVN